MLTVSDTAFAIAAVRADEGLRPPDERLFEDSYAALFCAAGGHAAEGTKRFLDLPFFRDGIRIRTKFIDDVLVKGLAGGLDQVVLLGAGFDARALRLPSIVARGARVYEIDLPKQLDNKRAVLAAAEVVLPPWVSYVPCDLTAPDFEHDLLRSLQAVGFRCDRSTFFVWEGVTTYIGVAATDKSLRFMATIGAPGSQVVFDIGTNFFGAETVTEHASRAGFSSCEAYPGDELWKRYLRGEPHPAASVFRMAIAYR